MKGVGLFTELSTQHVTAAKHSTKRPICTGEAHKGSNINHRIGGENPCGNLQHASPPQMINSCPLKVLAKVSFVVLWYIVREATSSRRSHLIRAMNDYAVVRLNEEIPGRREFPKFSAVNDDNFGTVGQIHIIGYPQNHYPEMWQSSCSVQDSRLMLHSRFLMSTCSSHQGLSGAAALVDNVRTRDQQMRLIGITSNMVLNERMMPKDQRLSVVLILNQQKISDICQHVGSFTDGLSSCA